MMTTFVPVIAEGRVILKDDYVDKLNNSDEEDLNDLRRAQKEKILNTQNEAHLKELRLEFYN